MYMIWYSQYVIWYGCILTLGGCTSSKHHKSTYYHSLTQFYRLFLQYNSSGFKKYRGSYGSTLYKEGKLYEQIHVKKPSLAFWPKTHFTLFFTFLWQQNKIRADNLCECTMAKLMLLFLHILKLNCYVEILTNYTGNNRKLLTTVLRLYFQGPIQDYYHKV